MTQVVMFPGQGSQIVGMGKDLFLRYPEYIEEANDCFGFDLQTLCKEGPDELLTRTDNAQAAIFVTNALSYLDWIEHNEQPDIVLGHSIGQYNAMLAAGMMTFRQGLELVKYRGALMVEARDGAMAAVMKMSDTEIELSLKKTQIGSAIDIANYNSEQQIVISGPEKAIIEATDALQKAGGFVVRLKTSGAFHSRYLLESKESFSNKLEKVKFCAADIQLICNVTASEMDSPNQALAEHLVSPVKWSQSIHHVLDIDNDAKFIECGQGKTLTNLLRYNKKEHKTAS